MITFTLNEKEEKLYHEFCEKHRHYSGAIGGHILVEFTVTSIGDMPTVKCDICHEELNLTDYDKL